MWPNLQETADLVTFTGEILNEKLYFLCSMHCLMLLLLILIIKLSKCQLTKLLMSLFIIIFMLTSIDSRENL